MTSSKHPDIYHSPLKPKTQIDAQRLPFFSINYDEFTFSLRFGNDTIKMRRNDFEVIATVPMRGPDATLLAKWEREKLTLCAFGHDRTPDGQLIGKANKDEIDTSPVRPPASLLGWVEEQGIIPVRQHSSITDFQRIIIAAVQDMFSQVRQRGAFELLWDKIYDGNKVIGREPKREPDCQKLIGTLLATTCKLKSLELHAEEDVETGKIDFYITGRLSDGESLRACVEVKLGHSSDLEAGLLYQLPQYMECKRTDFGIYVVLCFDRSLVNPPDDGQSVAFRLQLLMAEARLNGIRVLTLDCTSPEAASVQSRRLWKEGTRRRAKGTVDARPKKITKAKGKSRDKER